MFAQELRAALAALSFLTRIPVPTALAADDVRRSGPYFPFVGAGLGACTGAVSRRYGPAAALAAQTLVTGALHLDALADSADALGTSDRERALEIMQDSRIGPFGTVAICLDLAIKAAALERCDHPIRALAVAGTLSRAVPVGLSAALPYARSTGTGRAISDGGPGRALVATGLAASLSLMTAGSRDAEAIAVTALVAVASGAFWQRRIGGVTGDTLGASIECCEAAILFWSTR